MDQRQCRLSKDGAVARDHLLTLLYPGNSYTKSQLGTDTGLTRGSSIAKLLGEKDDNVQQRTIEQFFKSLLKILSDQINDDEFQAFLQMHGLNTSYKQLLERETSFYLPNTFYEPGRRKKAAGSGKSSQKAARVKSDEPNPSKVGNAVNLFWELDYKQQERDFEDALEKHNQCVAFSLTAPCDTTQRWILNRLMRQIPNVENALILPAISLKHHRMRHQFEQFWEDLSEELRTKPLPDEVLKGMCHSGVDRPIILTIYEFQQFKKAQEHLLKTFWEPLARTIVGSKRSEDSRIVLFLVDQTCPSQDVDQLIHLPLGVITQQDVTKWLSRPLVKQWWQPRFGDHFKQELIERLIAAECQDPYFVIDKLCSEFGIEGEIMGIEEAWKWGEAS